jgi:DNA-binding MarR family transcriptional regulator
MDAYASHVLASRFGVDHNLFFFLSALEDGPLDITRLAERLVLTKAAVSKRVPSLARDGWVTASPDPDHGRRVIVRLTPRGRTLVRQAGALLNEQFSELVAELDVDAGRLAGELEALAAAIRAWHAADGEAPT